MSLPKLGLISIRTDWWPRAIRLGLCLSLVALVTGPPSSVWRLSAKGVAAKDNPIYRFDFGPGKVAKGYTQVTAANVYSKAAGFGFEPGPTIVCQDRKTGDPVRSDFCSSDRPFYFSVALPEGNYKVTLILGDAEGETSTTVKAELRRLMLERVETARGHFVVRSFTVNVRTPKMADDGEVKLKDREKTSEWWAWDEKLTLEFNDSRACVTALEISRAENLPTIYLLGDSTVCDQALEPYASWGQMLTRFFSERAVVANHAESGESLRSSLAAHRLDKVLSTIKAGDYMLIQYGHNDEKERGAGVGAFTTYRADLKKFVSEARKRGAVPILITPMHRRTFDQSGKITNSHGDYPEAVRQAALEENVPLIDLNAMSKTLYEALGPEKSGALFKPGDGTHHNNYGSYELAKCVVEGIRAVKPELARYLVKDLGRFDPAHPDTAEAFRLPASPTSTTVKPLGN